MTDRELLELAAKAIGLTLKYNFLGSRDARQRWDPLTDDGDALRLAVKLGIEFYSEGGEEDYAIWANCEMIYVDDHDPCAATRRAIVRAAASIGKDMP